ncbi:hypothetical protein PC116_g13451 [Phytophthora cactorum]|uniref:Uncharacterized protein n=1 Tax=Phytophthora cactorum TaxID=29920 RepID=A0A8T1FH89_9STRA|nr:hypothetical protein PC112_g9851 [Phytophthora cactorum]KAG2826951.1 hypothetical protein PC111_g8763 [Phytophthora cactorum]KAG2970277.1 hypothetical protein PC118_g16976 [Phytophthora cactorum]KAG4238541.1 hypothetical protein PC116_g13451 [Phytophthora cactorum]
MTYDFDNMVPHTCQSRQATEAASDESVCIDVEEEMKEFVDELAEQDIAANKIWTLAYKRFYEDSTGVVRGLSRKQVVARAGKSKSGTNRFFLPGDY